VILNQEPEEWTDPEAPPAYESVGEALEALGEPLTQEQIDAFNEEAQRIIDGAGPEHQMYLQRLDNGKVVATRREYGHCARKGVQLRPITYQEAVALLEVEGEKRAARKAKKEARKARRRG
jgi:hypothetical protein